MIKLSQQQRGERWDSLPDVLREAIVSETNSDFIWKTCQGEFIPEEKIYDAMGAVGLVLSGFLHPEDMATELAATLQIDRRIAEPIASAINQRIFVPLRPEIDKVYNPADGPVGPKIISAAEPVVPIAAVPIIVPPPLSEKGWSKMRPAFAEASAGKPSNIPPMPPKPQAAPMPFPQAPPKMPVEIPAPAPMPNPTAMTSPRPPMAPPKTMDQSGIFSISTAPEMPRPIPLPSVMAQRIDAPKQIKNDPDFHITTKSTENIMPGGAAQTPLRNAVLELGESPTKAVMTQGKNNISGNIKVDARIPAFSPSRNASAEQGAGMTENVRVVHYSDLKSSLPASLPLGKTPVAESGRRIVEMTAPDATPIMPKLVPTASAQPTTMSAKPSAMPVPMPRPTAAPMPMLVKQAVPTMPPVPKPLIPKPAMPAPMPMPPKPA